MKDLLSVIALSVLIITLAWRWGKAEPEQAPLIPIQTSENNFMAMRWTEQEQLLPYMRFRPDSETDLPIYYKKVAFPGEVIQSECHTDGCYVMYIKEKWQ